MLELLRSILADNIIHSTENNIAILKENNKNASLKIINITNILESDILLHLDNACSNTIFKGTNGENKRCDYVLTNNKAAYFIEIKSTKNPEHKLIECTQKFKATECILEYIDSVIHIIYEQPKIFNKLEKRYILIYKATPIAKTPTRRQPDKSNKNNSPEHMLTLAVENESKIHISKLKSDNK